MKRREMPMQDRGFSDRFSDRLSRHRLSGWGGDCDSARPQSHTRFHKAPPAKPGRLFVREHDSEFGLAALGRQCRRATQRSRKKWRAPRASPPPPKQLQHEEPATLNYSQGHQTNADMSLAKWLTSRAVASWLAVPSQGKHGTFGWPSGQ